MSRMFLTDCEACFFMIVPCCPGLGAAEGRRSENASAASLESSDLFWNVGESIRPPIDGNPSQSTETTNRTHVLNVSSNRFHAPRGTAKMSNLPTLQQAPFFPRMSAITSND